MKCDKCGKDKLDAMKRLFDGRVLTSYGFFEYRDDMNGQRIKDKDGTGCEVRHRSGALYGVLFGDARSCVDEELDPEGRSRCLVAGPSSALPRMRSRGN